MLKTLPHRVRSAVLASFTLNLNVPKSMKTLRWFNRNRFISIVRVATAGALVTAAAALAFVAGGNRLLTVSSPASDLAQDREVKGKMAGDPDAAFKSARTRLGESPVGGYEAYKSAARTY